ncbi:MAG: type II toxin-antitoxin system ParD family antitoxin [Opitutales bacterium]
MNVSLTDQLENFVNRLVERGRYRSASEVVREGLRLLEIRESQLKDSRDENGNNPEQANQG